MGDVKILQSDLQNRAATQVEQEELDRRTEEIGQGKRKDEELFDKEPEKEPVKEPSEESLKEEKPAEESDEVKNEDAKLLEADDETLSDEQKTRKADLVKAKDVVEAEEEDKRILEADEKELNDTEKARKIELVNAKEGEKTEEEKKTAFDTQVKAYSKEYEVSEEVAKNDVEAINKLLSDDTFKGDKTKLAKSYLHLQRHQAKTAEELKALRNKPQTRPVDIPTIAKVIEEGKFMVKGKPATKEEIVEAYSTKFPEITEGVDEEVIFKMACKDIKSGIENRQREGEAQFKVDAKTKRDKLIEDLSDADKKFLPVLQPVLDQTSDRQIMSEEFDLGDMIQWAKGKTYTDAVKEAEERGFKRGVEARKILGEIQSPKGGAPKTKKGSGSKSGLTKDEEQKAEEMFSGNDIPVARKHELYKDILDHDKELAKREAEKEAEKNKK